ncbi:MAG: alkaline shock response membrane anchor protein AmaP [Clostridia bacterium]|nr:alkaline shock response membrane anchor protein AmaP [Clostridia bacterium]
MKFFDKLSFKIYSLIILMISLIFGILLTNLIELSDIVNMSEEFISEYFWWTVVTTLILIVWSVRNIIYGGNNISETTSGILLENKNGKLLITKDSISNLIETVVKENSKISNVSTKLEFDESNNITVFLNISVDKGISVKDTTADIQKKIKETVKKTTDLDIREINIKIKNIEQIDVIKE